MPPSRTEDDPEYDDRSLQVLYKVAQRLQRQLDIRELIR